ncbi:MAG TPA: PAS domain-containing protein [Polyangiaceae bacterium]|nr:PAS domain-containing protein [Polyangiaceae bacterium]
MGSAVQDEHEGDDALRREVVALRLRVAELQRAAARHEDTEDISPAEREELALEVERVAHLGTWTWDIASGRVTWSDEMYRILGRDPGSVTPSVGAFFAAVHPDDLARTQSATEQSLREGVLPLVDCRIVRPDGSIRHTTASSSMLFDAGGTGRRIVGTLLDRTESLRGENELRRVLGLLEEAQRFAQLGSWRFNPSNGELEWSPEFRRIAGLPADVTPRAELFLERIFPEDRARISADHERARADVEGSDVDARLLRPDGQVRHVRLQGFAMVNPDGTRELRGTMLDVTDQVRMREELVHAQKMQAVGRLAGGIAHDFNNLLTVITGNLELLADSIGTTPELDASLQALSSAARLTQRLLAFGRKAHLTLKRVAPNDLVQRTMSLMQRLVGDEVRLELQLEPDLPQIRVDPLELERALVNLVVNARDSMPGGGLVRIGTSQRRVNGAPEVEIFVADQGPGIDDAIRAHIFEPFFTTRAQAGGTGLGLATVLGTAEQHGGTVRVEPGYGGGSVFTIVLPAAPASPEPEARAAPARVPRRVLRPLTLLVIDDEPEIAAVTRRMLEGDGHRVYVAVHPDDALLIWAEHGAQIDLVICDVAMARVRGPALVARLAARGRTPRVLFITGYSEEVAHAELRHAVLAKPYTASTLAAAIGDIVGHEGER